MCLYLCASVVHSLTPSELRAALVAAGVTGLANFTCQATVLFGSGGYSCRNGNVISVELRSSRVSSFQLPDIDCEGEGSTAGPSVFVTPPVFIRLNSALTSLTFGSVRNCPEVYVGNHESLKSLSFLGTLHNVTELVISANQVLSGTVAVAAQGLAAFPAAIGLYTSGNVTNQFNFTYSTNASLSVMETTASLAFQ